jgi:hypothetical protein
MERFFAAETYAAKMRIALSWEHQAAPGTVWVYHTSDAFLLTQALQGYLQRLEGNDADLFDFVVEEVYRPIGLGPGAWTTLRTRENHWQGRPLGGYGLFWIADDLAKLGVFLNANGGKVQGTPLLQPDLLAEAMQQKSEDRGLPTGPYDFMYNNGFWAHLFTRRAGYACDFWVPFMSGYGGITVALLPNGVVYYVISDNGDFDWYDVVREVDRHILSLCP